jgi:hypothetical protein
MFAVYLTSLWPVADVLPRDKYGHAPDDQNYQLEDAEDYVDFLPKEKRVEAQAMKCASAWNMNPDDVMDMQWSEFNEKVLVHKAITLRKPQYTPNDYIMERTSSRYKARKRK